MILGALSQRPVQRENFQLNTTGIDVGELLLRAGGKIFLTNNSELVSLRDTEWV